MYKDGRPLGFPTAVVPPAPQGPYYTGVGYANVGAVAREIVEKHLEPLPVRRHQPRRHQRRSGQGPVGIPDLRQRLQEGRRRNVDGPLSAAAPDRNLRASTSSITASRSAIPTGTARACTPTSRPTYLREVGGKAYFEALMAAFDKNLMDHIAVYGPGQRQASDRQARDCAVEQVQLRHRGPRRLDPRAALLRQQRLQGLSGRSPPELARRPLRRSLRRSSRRLLKFRLPPSRQRPEPYSTPGWGRPGCHSDPSKRNRFDGSLRF